MNQAQIEALKEFVRVVVLALIGFAVAYLGELPQTETVVIVLSVLRFADKYIHEDKSNPRNGLLPF